MSRFTVERQKIVFDSGKDITFAHTIAKTIDCDKAVVVMLDVPQGTIFNENVFGVSPDATILWQVPKEEYVYADSPYTDIKLAKDTVVHYNWDGLRLTVEPATGKILEKDYGK
jgi:hypothetical protein